MCLPEEDTEFRDLIAQTLENNGVLGKIRAQLRSSIFLALEDQDKFFSMHNERNKALTQFLATAEGSLTLALIKDFFEYFNMESTLNVLEAELGGRAKEAKLTGLNTRIPDYTTKSRPYIRHLVSVVPVSDRPINFKDKEFPMEHKVTSPNKVPSPKDSDQHSKASTNSRYSSKASTLEDDAEPFFDTNNHRFPIHTQSNNSAASLDKDCKRPTAVMDKGDSKNISKDKSKDKDKSSNRSESSESAQKSSFLRDLPPLPNTNVETDNRRQQFASSTTKSDLSNQLEGSELSYADDFEDSLGAGGGRGGGLQSQASEVGIEEVYEEIPSVADDERTDVTLNSEYSLDADYVEDFQKVSSRH